MLASPLKFPVTIRVITFHDVLFEFVLVKAHNQACNDPGAGETAVECL
jgi:hypothetical protein